MKNNPHTTPVVWTLICCNTDGGADSYRYNTYAEAYLDVSAFLSHPDCELVTIGYQSDWSAVTLFMFTSEVQNDQPIQIPGVPRR